MDKNNQHDNSLSIEQTRKKLREGNIKIKNQSAFNPDYIPEKIMHRNKQHNELTTLFKSFLNYGGVDQVHLVGPNSTGKTLLTRYWRSIMSEEIEQEVNYLYVNCGTHSDWQQILEQIGKKLGVPKTNRGNSLSLVLERIFKEIKETKTVIVLDEFDKLTENSRSKIVIGFSRPREVVDPSPDLYTVICSNDRSIIEKLDRERPDRTHTSAWNNRKIEFDNYNKKELKDIFGQRFKKGLSDEVYDQETIEYVVETTENYLQGDLRLGLKVVKDSIDYIVKNDYDKLNKEIINASGARHIKDKVKTNVSDIQNQRVLKTLLSISCLKDSKTSKEIHDKYLDMYDDTLSMNTTRNHLNKLLDREIITRQNINRNKYIYELKQPYKRKETAMVMAEEIGHESWNDDYETDEVSEEQAREEAKEYLTNVI